MAVNNTVNWEQMIKMSQKIKEKADTMQNRFNNVYSDVTELGRYWQGDAYTDFVTKVNHLKDDFSRTVKYFGVTLPKEITKKAEIYAKAQNEYKKSKSKFNALITKVSVKSAKVAAKKTGQLKWDENKVLGIQDSIEKRFSNVEKDLVDISSYFDRIEWTGAARTTNKKVLENKVDETISAMKQIKQALTKYIKAATNANAAAESGNSTTSNTGKIDSSSSVTNINTATSELESENYNWDLNEPKPKY